MDSPIRSVVGRLGLIRNMYSFVDLVRHPEHLDRVFEISEALANRRVDVLEHMRAHFASSPTGATAIAERHRLSVDLSALAKLPPGTLGCVFANHMKSNNLDPAAIPTLAGDEDLAFVRAHLYETHDVWHAVTGFHSDVAGELGLQAFYAAQTRGGLPLMLLSMGFLNTALYAMGEREQRLDAIARGWQMGRRALPLFGVRWDRLWDKSVWDVRGSLGIEPYEAAISRAA